MHSDITNNLSRIHQLCADYGVARLELFGSAAKTIATAAPHDFDFLVQLDTASDRSKAKRWIGLAESLEALLGRTVDLVNPLTIRNPHFQSSVQATRIQLYAHPAT